MNELSSKSDQSDPSLPKYEDPPLLPSQIRLKELSDDMLLYGFKRGTVNLADFKFPNTDVQGILRRIRSTSLGDILLLEGDSLSFGDSTGYMADLNLFANDADLLEVSIRVRGTESDKYRIDPNGSQTSPFDVLEFPGEKDWLRSMEIRFTYGDKEHYASQKLTSYTESASTGNFPSYSRDIYAGAYAEMGYDGHNQNYRYFTSEEEANLFYDLVGELFEAWKVENPDKLANSSNFPSK